MALNVRPALINSGDLTADARVIHRGKRLRVVQAEITSEEGNPVVYATSSMLVVPHGAFDLIGGIPPTRSCVPPETPPSEWVQRDLIRVGLPALCRRLSRKVE